MKSKFMNAAFTGLINEKDYLPFRDAQGAVLLRDDILPLQKSSGRTFFIVELIDGDMISIEELGQKLMKSRNFLEQSDPNQVCQIIEIFVFNSEPPASKAAIFQSVSTEKNFCKKYLTCLTVNLDRKEVNKSYGLNFVDGIDGFLSGLLKNDLSHYVAITDIDRMVKEKENKSAIKFKVSTPIATYLLIAANIAVWVLFSLYAKVKGLDYDSLIIVNGAKDNFRIFIGEYWRFLTPVFLHGNLPHLFLNSYSLYAVGVIVEKIYGRSRFLIIYFLAGVFGNIASFMFSPGWGAGASGAIFGLVGALFYFGVENPVVFKKYFGYNLIVMLAINIVYGFSTAGIDNSAHLGGLAGGFLAAGVAQLEGGLTVSGARARRRLLALLLIVLTAGGGLYYGFNSNQNLGFYHLNLGWNYYNSGRYHLAKDELLKAKEISRGDKKLEAMINRIEELMK